MELKQVDGLELYGKVEELLLEESEGEKLWELYLDQLEGLGVQSVLDIGCGGGRFCQKGSARGFQIEGIDLSKNQIAKAVKRGCNCHTTSLSQLTGYYNAGVAVFDVVNYLPPSQLTNFFETVYRLTDHFLFDINTYFGMADLAVGTLKREGNGKFLCLDSRFEEGKLITTLDLFIPTGNGYFREKGEVIQYYHPLEKIVALSPFPKVEVTGVELYGSGEDEKWLILMKK